MLLSKLRSYLNVEAENRVYLMTLVTYLLTYSETVRLNFTKMMKDKLKLIGRGTKLITSKNTKIVSCSKFMTFLIFLVAVTPEKKLPIF